MHLIAFDLEGRDPELIADRCWMAGAAGIWEVDETTLRAGVEADDLPQFLVSLADLDPVDVTATEAVELAGRSAQVSFAGHDIDLWVPATIFGDGHHPTTASCLGLMIGHIGPDTTVLDVGCGAGALSIGAALLGGRVTALDLDPEAVITTAANAARNGVSVETVAHQLASIEGRFDVVLANMTSGSLGPLVADLVRCTAPGGVLVVSGLLEDQWPAIRDAIGGEAVDVRVVEGWLSATVELP